MILPSLSQQDPVETSESSLDPLALYAIADSLAVRLIPGVRERQVNPRFLTLIAVSFHVCEDIDQSILPKDGYSPPWQVFEWYVVEGLVRKFKDPAIPGNRKTRQALEQGFSLDATKYLKTPSVFGFHGVYRLLSRDLKIDVNDHLGHAGNKLLDTWVDEQGLPGFINGSGPGIGKNWFQILHEAVREGYQKSAVSRKAGWQGWDFISNHLSPGKPGKNESFLIWNLLLDDIGGFRSDALRFLVSDQGQTIWQASDKSERAFHEEFKKQSNHELYELLEIIKFYEIFSRLMQDAFDQTRHELSHYCTNLNDSIVKLSRLQCVQTAAEEIPNIFKELVPRLNNYSEANRFTNLFSDFEHKWSASDFLLQLIKHHMRIQGEKPPNGRAPWVHILDDNIVSLRLRYKYESDFEPSSEYLHAYRTNSLWSFAQRLGRIDP